MTDDAQLLTRARAGDEVAFQAAAAAPGAGARDGLARAAPGRVGVVTVEFHAEGDGTRVELHQAGFADDHDRDMHADGWGGCLDNLARRVFAGG